MTYNIHPILVHFPIALLFLYSVIKILPVQKWLPKVGWRDIERVLLVAGVLGAFVSLATGETAEQLVRPNHQLVEAHAFFASLATWLYSALLLGEVAAIVNARLGMNSQKWASFLKVTGIFEKILCNKAFSVVLALVALIAIVLTGLLGGVMVYGVSADPIAPAILLLLGIIL